LEQIVALQKIKDESNDDPYDVGGAEYACLVQSLAQSVSDLQIGVRCDNKNDLVSGGRSCAKAGRGVGEQSASGCAVDGLQGADMCLLKRYAGVCLQEDTAFLLSLVMRRLEQHFPSIYRARCYFIPMYFP
jgi:hypothetical protein